MPMLNALILTATLLQSNGPSSAIDKPGNRIDQIVEIAWRDDEQAGKIDEKRQKDLDRDVDLGKEYSKQVEKELKLSKNEEYIKRVERIGQEMAAIANATQAEVTWGDKRPSRFKYQFQVVQGEDVNAFSLPGGFIYVYEGLVKYIESDDELAGVLGHEISHAAFRHVWALQRQSEKVQIGTLLALIVAAMTRSKDAGNILSGVQLGAQAFQSAWSQDAERAADYGGLQFMERSRYDPTGCVTFMERLARDERSKNGIDWGIFRTHPPSKERVQNLLAYMAKANLPVRRSAVTSTFRTQIKPGDNGNVEAWFNGKKIYTFAGSDALTRADNAAKKLDDFYDQVPSMIEVTDGEGVVLFNIRPLLYVHPDDAAAMKVSVQNLTEQTTKAIKGSLFSLAYRIWGS